MHKLSAALIFLMVSASFASTPDNLVGTQADKFSGKLTVTTGQRLAQTNADIALFQEAYKKSDREDFMRKSPLNIGVYFDKKLFIKTTGLFTAAKYPVASSAFFPFSLGGPFWTPTGVGLVNYSLGDNVLTTLNTQIREKDSVDRWNELFEIFAFVVEQAPSDTFIIGGDFKMTQANTEYIFWKQLTGLKHAGSGTYFFVSPHVKINSATQSPSTGLTTELTFEKDAYTSSAIQRKRTLDATINLLSRLNEKYKNPDLDDNGKKSRAAQRLARYIEALASNKQSKDPAVNNVRAKLEVYFGLFD